MMRMPMMAMGASGWWNLMQEMITAITCLTVMMITKITGPKVLIVW